MWMGMVCATEYLSWWHVDLIFVRWRYLLSLMLNKTASFKTETKAAIMKNKTKAKTFLGKMHNNKIFHQ